MRYSLSNLRGLPIRIPADHKHVSVCEFSHINGPGSPCQFPERYSCEMRKTIRYFCMTDAMTNYNKTDCNTLPLIFQGRQNVVFPSNWHGQTSTPKAPPSAEIGRQQGPQDSQQQPTYSWVFDASLNRLTSAPYGTYTTGEISQYLDSQYARDSKQKRIGALMIEILSKLPYQKAPCTALDLTTLYRVAFATLKPATTFRVLLLWGSYAEHFTISQSNDAGEVILKILLRDYGHLQPVFLRHLSHALRNTEIDHNDGRVLKWSIAMRKFQFLGMVK